MKINKEVEKLIFDAAMTANSVGIDSFVIDEDGIRGADESKLVVILKQSFDLEVPFEGFAVGDVAQFVQRYNIHNNNDPKSIDLELGDDLNTLMVSFKSKNLKIDYRCVKPARIQAPKKLKDSLLCSFELTEEAIDMIKRGSVTMKADEVLFVKDENSDEVYMQMVDINKSQLKYDIDGRVECEDDSCMFAHRYPVKALLAALKDCDDNFVDIGEAASLTIRKNGINIIIPSRVS